MQFLYPSFLFALFALAIPIIIHLFNFRRYKKLLFTNVQFLSDVQQEQKSRNKLRHLLILIMRMLVIACAVIAFAQPFFPSQSSLVNPGKKYVSIYVDNSFSMNNVGAQGDLLEEAKRKAGEIAKAFKESDAFQLVTNDFELRQQRWVNRPEFLQMLSEVKISPAFRTASQVFSRMQEGFRKAETGNRLAYMLSDFQEPMADFAAIKKDTSIALTVLPLKASRQDNVYIDSTWFDGAFGQLNKPNTLNAVIVNSSPKEVEDGTVTLTVNGQQKALANYKIPANGKVSVRMVYTITETGPNKGVLSIEDYPISFDNQLYFSYNVAQNIPVLVINAGPENASIKRAFAAENAFVVDNVNQGNIDYSGMGKYQFIVLNGLQNIPSGLSAALHDFLNGNGNVLIVPPAQDMDMESYAAFLGSVSADRYMGISTVNRIALSPQDLNKPFFKNIFEEIPRDINMPVVSKYYTFASLSSSSQDVLLRMNDGNVFLAMNPVGVGSLFTLAVPLDSSWSSFTAHALFLPALYKMAFYRQQEAQLYFTIGKDNYIQAPNVASEQEKVFQLTKDSIQIIPPQRAIAGKLNLFVENLIPEAGFYKLADKDAPKNSKVENVYAFNYSRQESVMHFLDDTQIKDQAGKDVLKVLDADRNNLAGAAIELQTGTHLWKWFIVAALVFLLAESVLIRFWK